MEIFNLYSESGTSKLLIEFLWMLPGLFIFGVIGYLISIKLNLKKQEKVLVSLTAAIAFIALVGLLAIDDVMFNSKWGRDKLVLEDAQVLKGVVSARREKKGRHLYEVIEIGSHTLWRIAPVYDKYLPDACYPDLIKYSGSNNKESEIRYVPLYLNENEPSEVSYCITYVATL
ncbi:hypothetical protein [Photobacterium sp. GB-210]|uniref:hypothetical protein n=1 Tax=Photobacterium sp. GB-210 TaxID=2022104 RepID=UPI000D16FE22|nr:hypothetical protein [Photobacterium sp. GB-210]PSV41137.1 hypothetical protein C9J38_03630 [Photobacterium sp. GB-210]